MQKDLKINEIREKISDIEIVLNVIQSELDEAINEDNYVTLAKLSYTCGQSVYRLIDISSKFDKIHSLLMSFE